MVLKNWVKRVEYIAEILCLAMGSAAVGLMALHLMYNRLDRPLYIYDPSPIVRIIEITLAAFVFPYSIFLICKLAKKLTKI